MNSKQEFAARYVHFQNSFVRLKKRYDVETLANDIFIVHPRKPISQTASLTVGAIIHGNETNGLDTLTEYLNLLNDGFISLNFSLGLFLGNVPAAKEGKRFVERDLNRSFNMSGTNSWEESRAREIMELLKRTELFIDLHQTNLPSETPFYIFPYSANSLIFANAINPYVPIVTHWSGNFSADGMCSDEAVNACGGIGLTLETGQAGFNYQQMAFSVYMLLKAHKLVNSGLGKEGLLAAHQNQVKNRPGKIYTWAQSLDYPKSDINVLLEPGWYNFKPVRKNQKIGTIAGKDLTADTDGLMLFPKYHDPAKNTEAPPKELCRIIKEITVNDLPQ